MVSWFHTQRTKYAKHVQVFESKHKIQDFVSRKCFFPGLISSGVWFVGYWHTKAWVGWENSITRRGRQILCFEMTILLCSSCFFNLSGSIPSQANTCPMSNSYHFTHPAAHYHISPTGPEIWSMHDYTNWICIWVDNQICNVHEYPCWESAARSDLLPGYTVRGWTQSSNSGCRRRRSQTWGMHWPDLGHKKKKNKTKKHTKTSQIIPVSYFKEMRNSVKHFFNTKQHFKYASFCVSAISEMFWWADVLKSV